MNRFSLGLAFSETFGFLRRNWKSMLLWMGGAVLLLAVLFIVIGGGNFLAFRNANPNDPMAIFALLGQFFLFGIVAMVVLYGAGMMIWRMGLSPEGSTGDIGWALLAGLLYAFAMLVVMLAAYIVIALVVVVIMLMFGVAGGAGAMFGGTGAGPSGALLIGMIVIYFLVMVAMFWLQGRLMIAGPVMADRKLTNPFTAIGESWRLSAPSQWKILGFLIVFLIATYLILLLLVLLSGAIGGSLGKDSTAGAVTMVVMAIIVYVPFLMLWMSLPAGIYLALGGSDDVEEVFA